jgi:hypothetical protein
VMDIVTYMMHVVIYDDCDGYCDIYVMYMVFGNFWT